MVEILEYIQIAVRVPDIGRMPYLLVNIDKYAVSIPEIGVGLTGHLWPFHRPDRRCVVLLPAA